VLNNFVLNSVSSLELVCFNHINHYFVVDSYDVGRQRAK